MTTDPRVIECAKAMLADAILRAGIGVGARHFDDIWALESAIWINKAQVCVLKWLEQEPTHDMLDAKYRRIEGVGYTDTHLREGDVTHSPKDAYTAMCAQAAQEIAK